MTIVFDCIFTSVLVAGVVTNGLLAGVFFAFSCAINPGFRHIDDRSYVGAFRAINGVILNGWFLSVFLVAPLTAVAGAILAVGREDVSAFGWLVVGAACSVLSFGITAAGNVPLNRALDRAPADTAQRLRDTRKGFEAPWNRWNHTRTVLSTGALVTLVIAASGQS
ncbi:hypothetical protein HMPREF0183_0635 [Brevibacterium mcbrellneri ATCC 49030]|uniref:DUF1772 domain-containing protein n=2 Tax=Micrococcales TaxID=85006 RepID=D4YL25_9MICO|nr:DUF1772 domain-containing protein [Pseudoglutamicibacter albus]EFG48119.1 hypothetical protein HMPREF0183_0635 [Brevibacterium mcbrellneri ATCC 49030]MBX7555594.1 DUF1772 domain-containing protein [Streptomyces sp. tea 10]MCG7298083.1 DUF1772 domain-containing protein [Brevibacterium sp. ACRRH]MDR7294392.1 putative membrane protein [Pseudoglutamicibacter albus]